MATEAIKQYGTEIAAGGEPVYPAWADDLKELCKIVSLQTQPEVQKCKGCFGRGKVDNPPWGIVACPECDGSGMKTSIMATMNQA